MLLLIKYTLLYGIVLMLVALGGMFSEHSGIINIALEGIMVIGGVAGVLTLTLLPADMSPFLVVLLTILAAALAGMVYSLLLAINPAHAWADGFVRILKGGFHDAPYGCLLYTSPSPRDRQKSRMPSSA